MSDGYCQICKAMYSLHSGHAHPLGPPPGLELGKALLKQALEGPDPYQEPAPPGPNPGGAGEWQKVIESLKYQPALVRNMAVGPFVVSTCQCPQCGELFVYYQLYRHDAHNNAYSACLAEDAQPVCHRCLYATAWPTPSPKVIEAMVELRWRYGEYLAACEVASMKSQAEQRLAFIRAHDAFWLHGKYLLAELEAVFGDQLQRALAAVESGVSGVSDERGG